MINGFHIDIPSSELKTHLAARAAHHRDRAAWYETQKGNFADTPQNENVSNDPVRALKDAGERHLEKAAVFAFLSEHVAPNEVYRLSEHEASHLEFIKGRGW